ncbi:23 kDa integral membrane protein [Anabrus simplex]|uniref:23 kDa integral membrane protein n=1 Tax=Anabrus simplex TaxID=316456 RepID=UPI0034DD8E40
MALKTECLKYLVLGFSTLLLLLGVVLMVLMAIILAHILEYGEFLADNVIGPPVLMIVMGLVSCCLSALIWQGATKEKKWLINLSCSLLGLVIIAMFVAAIWALILRASLISEAESRMNQSLSQFVGSLSRHEEKETIAGTWDTMQSKLQCCGVAGPSDYRSKGVIPYSCCNSGSPQEGDCHRTNQRGCVRPLAGLISRILLDLACVAFGAAALQIVGVFMSCWLSNSVTNERRRQKV